MDSAELHSQLEDLTSNIDDLEDALGPLLKTALSASTSKLPLLDKAKLYVLATYAIESLLFSYLRLNGVVAKDHPVFQELSRVKAYFRKIKDAETAGQKPTSHLDKAAAERFVRAGLGKEQKVPMGRHTRLDCTEVRAEKRKWEGKAPREVEDRLAKRSLTRDSRLGKGMQRAAEVDAEEAEHAEGSSVVPSAVPGPGSQRSAEHGDIWDGMSKFERDISHNARRAAKGKAPKLAAAEKLTKRGDRLKRARDKIADIETREAEDAETSSDSSSESEDDREGHVNAMHDPLSIASSGGESVEKIFLKKAKASQAPRGHREAFQALLNAPIARPDDERLKEKRTRKGQMRISGEDKRTNEMK